MTTRKAHNELATLLASSLRVRIPDYITNELGIRILYPIWNCSVRSSVCYCILYSNMSSDTRTVLTHLLDFPAGQRAGRLVIRTAISPNGRDRPSSDSAGLLRVFRPIHKLSHSRIGQPIHVWFVLPVGQPVRINSE